MNQLEWYYENMEIPSKAKKKKEIRTDRNIIKNSKEKHQIQFTISLRQN